MVLLLCFLIVTKYLFWVLMYPLYPTRLYPDVILNLYLPVLWGEYFIELSNRLFYFLHSVLFCG